MSMSEPLIPNDASTAADTVTPPPLPPPAAAPPSRPRRNPVVALVLSLFPGLGQMYNGQLVKALVFFFAWAGAIWFTAEGIWQFGLVIPFVYLLNLIDAYRSAAYLGARPAALEFDASPESPAWGLGLVALGAVLLLNNLGWLPLRALGRYWPLLLIAAGAGFVWAAAKRRRAE